ncbi:hypothetical protein V2A60_008053 [Cordyceps javanica]
MEHNLADYGSPRQDFGWTIAQHAEQCRLLLESKRHDPDLWPEAVDPLDDQLARFRLWECEMDVFGRPEVSLDHTLRYSPAEAESLHKLLDVICAWIKHMKNDHEQIWQCRAPSHGLIIFHNAMHYEEHMARTHDAPDEILETISSTAKRPIFKTILQCPFNDGFQAPVDTRPDSLFASKALERHITYHLYDITLLALGKLPSDEGESNMNSRATNHLDHKVGAKPAKFRASMDSVLDNNQDLVFRDGDGAAETANVNLDQESEGLQPSVARFGLEDRKTRHKWQNFTTRAERR